MPSPQDRIARLVAHCFPGAEAVWVALGEAGSSRRIGDDAVAALVAAVRRGGLGVVVPDVAAVPSLAPLHDRLGALAGLPLPEGTLLLLSPEARRFSSDDREALADLAGLAAMGEADRPGTQPTLDHGLRTPLTNLLGFADLLVGLVDGEAADYVERIRANGRELLDGLCGSGPVPDEAGPESAEATVEEAAW